VPTVAVVFEDAERFGLGLCRKGEDDERENEDGSLYAGRSLTKGARDDRTRRDSELA
jgi:hypothetical protein